ncbi:MAG TPA: hypothetical protein VKV19_13925 [Ktedonobacteraceae bacterium]|nr:hypothetical protein [Ktedonobacteraceae bacterium]
MAQDIPGLRHQARDLQPALLSEAELFNALLHILQAEEAIADQTAYELAFIAGLATAIGFQHGFRRVQIIRALG